MFDFHEKRKIRGWIYSKYTIGVILLLIALISTSTYERFRVERQMHERRVETEAQLNALQVRATALESKVEHLGNERGVEEELRNRFDVVKEGEQVVIILDSEAVSEPDLAALSMPPGRESENRSLLDRLKFWRW